MIKSFKIYWNNNNKKRMGQRIQIIKIRYEKEVATDTTEIQRIINNLSNKVDNQKEMDKFLERDNVLRLNQQEKENEQTNNKY